MKRRDFLAFASMTAAMAASPFYSVFADDQPPKKVLYYDYSAGFIHPPTVDHDGKLGSCGTFLKDFGQKHGIEVVCTKDGSVFDGDLSQYSAIIFYTSGNLDRKNDKCPGNCLSQQGTKNLYAAIRSGVGFLGFHSATDTWKVGGPQWENAPEDKRNDYINMVGGEFITHGSQQETTLKRVEPVELPSLKTLTEPIKFHDEWYCNKNFNKDMHVVMLMDTEGMKNPASGCYNRPSFPCVWVRKEGKGRVAYSAMGHGDKHWSEPLVQEVVGDLLLFVTGKLDIDTTPNFDKVCPDAVINNNTQEKK